MDDLIVEYLITLNNKEIFCNTVETFEKFMESNGNIKMNRENNELVHKELIIEYNIDVFKDESKYRFFNLKFILKHIDEINKFEKFLRDIRIMLNSISNSDVLVLWDDISLFYSIKAYPYIHKTENLMRKLLTKFMMINVGTEWNKENVPNDIEVKHNNNESNSTYNYLYQTDFIDLSKFLFHKYTTVSYENFVKKYNQDKTNYNIEDIIPKSNWDRYFKDIVNCEQSHLEKKWRQLYDLRNKIAHNNKLDKGELERICKLCSEIDKILENAINDLEKVKVEDKDKETVIQNIVLSSERELSEFIMEYTKLEDAVLNFSMYSINNPSISILKLRNSLGEDSYNILDFISQSFRLGFITKDIVEDTKEILLFKDLIVNHKINDDLSNLDVKNKIELIKKVEDIVYSIIMNDC